LTRNQPSNTNQLHQTNWPYFKIELRLPTRYKG
jgi:hypothetical protein